MIEKRKYPRLTLNVGVEYKILKGFEFESTTTQSKNISAGGICIIALDKFEVGSSLSLKFSLPELDKPINAAGRVVWIEEFSVGDVSSSKAYDAGIEFIHIQEEDREKISQYVRQRI